MSGFITKRTQYGFRFGAALVECCSALPEDRVVITVTTDSGRKLNIYVSRTGRSLRVFESQKELKA